MRTLISGDHESVLRSLECGGERPNGVFLHAAVPVPMRGHPARSIKKWVKNDEANAAGMKINR